MARGHARKPRRLAGAAPEAPHPLLVGFSTAASKSASKLTPTMARLTGIACASRSL